MDACLPFRLAYNELCAEQLCQLEERSDASAEENIKPFMCNSFQGRQKVPMACGIVHVLYIPVCLIDMQMVVKIRGSMEWFHRGHFDLLG